MANITGLMSKRDELKTINKSINNVKVEIKGYFDVETMANIVQTVALSCFQKGEFYAENREITRRYCIIKYMTDIELGDAGIEEVFKATQMGNWFKQIDDEVKRISIWTEIEVAIDKQIDFMFLTHKTSFDKLCSDISAIIKTDNTQNLADIKEILNMARELDAKKFVKAVTENVIEKTGGESNGKKSEGATE